MATNPDFEDLLQFLNEENAKFLLIGAYAVAFYSEPRFTKDIDLWIAPDPKNIDQIWTALARFGAPLEMISKADLQRPGMIYQIGIAPNRIDLLSHPGPFDFSSSWKNRSRTKYGKQRLSVIGIEDLIKLKKYSKRARDLEDVKRLRAVVGKAQRATRKGKPVARRTKKK